MVATGPADQRDGGAAFIRDDPPAVDLLLVDPPGRRDGLTDECRDGEGDAGQRCRHNEVSVTLWSRSEGSYDRLSPRYPSKVMTKIRAAAMNSRSPADT